MTIGEHYAGDMSEFENTLDLADEGARNDWEKTFVNDIRTRYEQYGGEMFMSDRQKETLEKIAGVNP